MRKLYPSRSERRALSCRRQPRSQEGLCDRHECDCVWGRRRGYRSMGKGRDKLLVLQVRPFFACCRVLGWNMLFRPGNQITTFSNKPSNASTIAVSTATPELILLNTQTGTVLRRSQVPSVLTHLHFTASQTYFVSGDADGWIRLHDPRDATTRSYGSNSIKAHLSGIQGIEATSTLLYTIGLGMR